jgi:hypothetical protein
MSMALGLRSLSRVRKSLSVLVAMTGALRPGQV